VTRRWWLVLAMAAGGLTIIALGIGAWELYCGKNIEAANWVMAAGGLGIIVFSTVQLHRDQQREQDRLAAARAKLKPAAWLARRMCEQAVIESASKPMNQWLSRWFVGVRMPLEGDIGANPIDVLQGLMRETVTLAAEASGADVRAADAAFDAFIAAANIINESYPTLYGGVDTTVYQAAMPTVRKAADHLAVAAHALEALAPRGTDEPGLPVNPRFIDQR
jgi:hypothetical protein